jgi:hypothetical protein
MTRVTGISFVLLALLLSSTAHAATLDVRRYGAKGDGVTNDSPAFSAAFAAAAPGDTVQVSAGTYLLDAALVLTKPLTLRGVGPASVLTHRRDLGTEGGAHLLRIGDGATALTGVRIERLTFAGPPQSTLRTPMIRVRGHVHHLTLSQLVFRDVSSSCILLIGAPITQVSITDNTALQWSEQFVELASGGIEEVTIRDNRGHTSVAHPSLGSTEPFGVVAEPRAASGVLRRIRVEDNVFSFAGMPTGDMNNSGGISFSNKGKDGITFSYSDIRITGNVISAAGLGIRVQRLREGTAWGAGSVRIERNTLVSLRNVGIAVTAGPDGSLGDSVAIVGNVLRGWGLQAHNRYDGISVSGHVVAPLVQENEVAGLTPTATTGRYGLSIGPDVEAPQLVRNVLAGWSTGAINDQSQEARP